MTGEPGLQPERTRLAWRRTLLSLTAVTLLLVRFALTAGCPGSPLVGLAALAGLVALALSWRRATGTGARSGQHLRFPLAALATAGLALLGVVLVLAELC